MRIGMFRTGMVASTVAGKLVALGHEVKIAPRPHRLALARAASSDSERSVAQGSCGRPLRTEQAETLVFSVSQGLRPYYRSEPLGTAWK